MNESFSHRYILVLASLLLVSAPGARAQKANDRNFGDVHGTVVLDGSPARGANIWMWQLECATPPRCSPESSSGKLRVAGKWGVDKQGNYGLRCSPAPCLLQAQLPKKVDPRQSRNILRIVNPMDGQVVTQNFDFSIRWREAEDPANKFMEFVNLLLASAHEVIPMKSMIKMTFGENLWLPNVILPGSDTCDLYSIASMEIDGSSTALPIVNCHAQYDNRENAETGYSSLVRYVTGATGWSTRTGTYGTQLLASGLPDYDMLTIRISKENDVSFQYNTSCRSPEFRRRLGERDTNCAPLAASSEIAPRAPLSVTTPGTPPQPSATETESAPSRQGPPANQQMSFGVLALASEREGVLFIDDQRSESMSAGKIVKLNLTAGQHFVDLRDSKGTKVWEKIITIPVGAQVVDKIDSHIVSPETHSQSNADRPVESPALTPSQPSDRAKWIESATPAFRNIVNAGDESIPFGTLKGGIRGDKKSWNGTTVLPGAKGCLVGTGGAGWPEYFCFWQYSSETDARLCYENWHTLIGQEPDWTMSSPPVDKDASQGASWHLRK